jgi:hypothetical protein
MQQTDIHLWSHLVQFFLEWEMFQTKVVKKTRILFTVTFPPKIRVVWDNVEKYDTAKRPKYRALNAIVAQPKKLHLGFIIRLS